MIYVTEQDDMVDAVCRRVYGTERKTTELVYAANPGLAAEGPVLPEGMRLVLPELPPQPAPTLATVNLWD